MSAVLLLAALILSPIIGGGFDELPTAILEILVFLATIVLVLRRGERANSWARAPGAAVLILAILLTVLSTFFSESIYDSLRQILFVAACACAYFVAATLAGDAKIVAASVWGVVLTALGICAVAIRNYIISTGGGPDFWASLLSTGEKMRLFGPFFNPGFFAGFLVLALPITLGVYLVTRRGVLALLAAVAFVIQMLALMLTGTKFGIVSAAFGLLVTFSLAIATKSLRRARFRRLLVIAVILLPLLLVFSQPVTTRIVAAESGGSQQHSTVFRVYAWQSTIDMIRAHPWVGVGPGAYAMAYPRYAIAGPTKMAHQGYLQFAAETGIPALAALVLVLVALAARSLRMIMKGQGEALDRSRKSFETASSKTSFAWADFVPFSGWRMLNCAIFGSLSGSVIRNLVDSDWYVIGISLPFWFLAGALVAQTGAANGTLGLGRRAKLVITAACAACVLMTLSFGVGALMSPDPFDRGSYEEDGEAIERCRLAAAFSPLNPDYRLELGKYLAFSEGDKTAAFQELDIARRLSPKDASVYYVRARVALRFHDFRQAIDNFQRVLDLNPNSTQALYDLALTYRALGQTAKSEETLNRLLAIENTEYEQVKGIPELVDTRFAEAHLYFARDYADQGKCARAAGEYIAARDRLERWHGEEGMRAIARETGMVPEDEDERLTEMLRSCYLGLAEAYEKLGNKVGAAEERQNAENLR